MAWRLVWRLLASWTPTPLHRWRVALIRAFGGNVDWSAHVYGSVRIWLPQNLVMGPHACLGPGVNCYDMAPITLDRGAIVSQGTHLCAGSHDIDDPDFQLVASPIQIETRAWVAAEAFIGPGVTVGEGCVVGARAVVFKSTEPHGVYVGNPATLVRKRKGMG